MKSLLFICFITFSVCINFIQTEKIRIISPDDEYDIESYINAKINSFLLPFNKEIIHINEYLGYIQDDLDYIISGRTPTAATPVIIKTDEISSFTVSSDLTASPDGNFISSKKFIVQDSTASINYTTGSIITSGGIGVDGDVHSSGCVYASCFTPTTGTLQYLQYSIYSPVTVANTVTETTLNSGSALGSSTISANRLILGTVVYIEATGYLSTAASTNPTLQIKFSFTNTVPVTITPLDTGANAMAGSLTNQFWRITASLTINPIGAAGSYTIIGQGVFEVSLGSGNYLFPFPMVMTATQDINQVLDQTFSLTAQWGTASASNTITCTNYYVSLLG
jgi:hypothetical protein